MRRFLVLIGVCGLLLSAQIEAKERTNKKSFWDLWGSESENTAPAAASSDFTLEGEGSGFDAKYESTHEDDEDFDVGSGDGSVEITPGKPTNKPDKNNIKPEATVEDVDDAKEGTEDKEDKDEKDDEYKFDDNVTDDDDLFGGSGSGDLEDYDEIDESKEIAVVNPVEKATPPTKPTIPTTSKPLSACENLRSSALNLADFVPECAGDGSFKKQQCTEEGNKGKYCWCVNQKGGEIQGTRLEHPQVPDCDFGTNLPGCVFTRIQHSEGDLGAYKPKCTLEGEYEPVQCQGSECWCVDKFGNELLGSIVNLPKQPDCSVGEKTTLAPIKKTDKPKTVETPEEEGSYEVIDNKDKDKDNNKEEVIILGRLPEEEDENNNNNDPEGYQKPLEAESQAILAQPGLLAAIIGGAVVGLLCMVLLVMFIVYRMRKKDEGSYALEEQKYQNYSYAKAPDKEFYA